MGRPLDGTAGEAKAQDPLAAFLGMSGDRVESEGQRQITQRQMYEAVLADQRYLMVISARVDIASKITAAKTGIPQPDTYRQRKALVRTVLPGYKYNPEAWARFLADNADVAAAVGLPPQVLEAATTLDPRELKNEVMKLCGLDWP